jgi:GT2 family glycosyltransferase
MSRIDVSVVVPTYNRANAIALTLQHLAGQSLPPGRFEVFVVDDGSTDSTAQVVTGREIPFDLTYVQQQNRGAAAARNLGVQETDSELILFLDSDVVPDVRLLETHVTAHQDPDKQLIVGRVKPWPRADTPWHERIVDSESATMDYGQQERALPFFMALGGNFSVTREAFQCIGGYDESFPAAGCEETEFAYRASLAGYKLCYQPGAVGYHNHPRTLGQRCQQQAAHMRSMALLITKHPELQTVIYGVDALMPLWASPRSARGMWRRGRASLLGLAPTRFILFQGLSVLDRLQRWPRLASFMFWRLLAGWGQAGFREGLAQYGNVPGERD